jgi:hypothetical protein
MPVKKNYTTLFKVIRYSPDLKIDDTSSVSGIKAAAGSII